jgi:putrescine transport system substrate-binding protein
MRPEIIAKSSNYLGYPNGNKSATAYVDEGLKSNPEVYPPAATLATLFPDQPLPLKIERLRTRVWSKVKSGT